MIGTLRTRKMARRLQHGAFPQQPRQTDPRGFAQKHRVSYAAEPDSVRLSVA